MAVTWPQKQPKLTSDNIAPAPQGLGYDWEGPHSCGPRAVKCTYVYLLKIIFSISSSAENNGEWQLDYTEIFRTKSILLTLCDLFNDTEF